MKREEAARGNEEADRQLIRVLSLRDAELAKKALREGANADLDDKAQGMSALRWAMALGSQEIAAALLEAGADPNRQGDRGLSPLHCAAMGENEEMLEMALQWGGDPSLPEIYGNSPLHLAVGRGGRKDRPDAAQARSPNGSADFARGDAADDGRADGEP